VRPSTALYTDHYELTMVQAALRSGVASHRSVFEVFSRRLPNGRPYGVVAGTTRLLDAIERFRFGPEELGFVSQFLDADTCAWLEAYRFTGTIDGYPEGEVWQPPDPVLTVEAPFAEAVVLETLALSILNHDSAVAAAASRIVDAAAGKPVIEMGGRRTHEEAAVAAARATYLAGFEATSNLEAGRRYGVPTTGTVAHAFILAHHDERAAFQAQVESLGPASTLLVDTCDLEQGIRHAVDVSGPELGAIRIDSGDLDLETRRARKLLDQLGARSTRIILTGDLNESRVRELAASCPVDGFGVGTDVVTGGGAPTAEFVYKLVARADHAGDDAPLLPVAKQSPGKVTVGGRKHSPLQVRMMEHGRVTWQTSLQESRALHEQRRSQ
jgi:nicotinate phosphoribosyltransferase